MESALKRLVQVIDCQSSCCEYTKAWIGVNYRLQKNCILMNSLLLRVTGHMQNGPSCYNRQGVPSDICFIFVSEYYANVMFVALVDMTFLLTM